MNQELLATTITFFKEQGGTYEAMHSQMLAGGIKEEEIQQLYQEILRLGLDPHAQAPQAPATQPSVTPVAVQPPTSQPTAPVATPTPVVQAPVIQAPTVQLSATPGAVSVASLSPFLANTAQGETFGIPVAPLPTPEIPSPAVTATKSIVPAILAILLFIGLGFGGAFAYAYLNPYTAFGTSMAQLLTQAGLPGVIPVLPTQEVAPFATTTPSLTEASSTLQMASTTEATSTDTTLESSSTQATSTTSIATSTSTTTEQLLVIHDASSTEAATSTNKK